MSQLPLEILMHIAIQSIETFAQMLALPPVARFLKQHRKYILSVFTTVVVTKQCTEYRIGYRLYREEGPAIEWNNGYKWWFKNGKLHRDGGPAIKSEDGYEAWYQNGKLHRDGAPAIIYGDGIDSWYENGKKIK